MSNVLRLGIAGLGTVGQGTVKILQKHVSLLSARSGRDIKIIAVNARDKTKDRGIDLSAYQWVDDPLDMAQMDKVDCIIELIGGSEGIAYDLVKRALSNGKHVVTANKALLAHHGVELAQIAEDKSVTLAYEAAVAGGIPAIKALREGMAANEVTAVYGILNGTCNYILTQMRLSGRDFAGVLKDAQALGYAEADPTFDIEGVDAGHKICLLASIAFGIKPDFSALHMTGIGDISRADFEMAEELGYSIKLLGIARKHYNEIEIGVAPCMVPKGSPIAAIEDVYNAVYIEGDFVDMPFLSGRGAGEGPTASAVVADIVDIARGLDVPVFGVPVGALENAVYKSKGAAQSPYYIRLKVLDQAGVIADISAILRDQGISIETMVQKGRNAGNPVPVILTTHECRFDAIEKACNSIKVLDSCLEAPHVMRIEAQL